jgi:hypothetical protein
LKQQVKVRLPPYVSPRTQWRRRLHEAIEAVLSEAGIRFTENDRLSLEVRLYMSKGQLDFHDVDNRLKDVMDALQGRIWGTKSKKPSVSPLIPNDKQVYCALVEKSLPPKQSHGLGHLVIRKLKPSG